MKNEKKIAKHKLKCKLVFMLNIFSNLFKKYKIELIQSELSKCLYKIWLNITTSFESIAAFEKINTFYF